MSDSEPTDDEKDTPTNASVKSDDKKPPPKLIFNKHRILPSTRGNIRKYMNPDNLTNKTRKSIDTTKIGPKDPVTNDKRNISNASVITNKNSQRTMQSLFGSQGSMKTARPITKDDISVSATTTNETIPTNQINIVFKNIDWNSIHAEKKSETCRLLDNIIKQHWNTNKPISNNNLIQLLNVKICYNKDHPKYKKYNKPFNDKSFFSNGCKSTLLGQIIYNDCINEFKLITDELINRKLSFLLENNHKYYRKLFSFDFEDVNDPLNNNVLDRLEKWYMSGKILINEFTEYLNYYIQICVAFSLRSYDGQPEEFINSYFEDFKYMYIDDNYNVLSSEQKELKSYFENALLEFKENANKMFNSDYGKFIRDRKKYVDMTTHDEFNEFMKNQ